MVKEVEVHFFRINVLECSELNVMKLVGKRVFISSYHRNGLGKMFTKIMLIISSRGEWFQLPCSFRVSQNLPIYYRVFKF